MGLMQLGAGMRPRDWQIDIVLHQSMEGRQGEETIEGWGLEGQVVEPGIDLVNRK